MHSKFWSKNLKGRAYSEDIGVDGRIILEWILRNEMESCGSDSSDSGQGPVAGSCEIGY